MSVGILGDTLHYMERSPSSIDDEQNFQQWYEEHARALKAFVYAHVANRTTADELIQEVWLKAWQNRDSFDDGSFRAWIFQIARNLIIDKVGRKKQAEPLANDVTWEEFLSDESRTSIFGQDEKDILHNCLKRVDEPFLSVIKLILEGNSREDIAITLGITLGTYDSRKSRATNQIKQCVESKLR